MLLGTEHKPRFPLSYAAFFSSNVPVLLGDCVRISQSSGSVSSRPPPLAACWLLCLARGSRPPHCTLDFRGCARGTRPPRSTWQPRLDSTSIVCLNTLALHHASQTRRGFIACSWRSPGGSRIPSPASNQFTRLLSFTYIVYPSYLKPFI